MNDCPCEEHVFVKFLTSTKIPVPTFAFPLASRAINEREKNMKLVNFPELTELAQSMIENYIIPRV